MKNSEALKKVETAIEHAGAFIYSTESVQDHGNVKDLPGVPDGEYTLVSVRIAVPNN